MEMIIEKEEDTPVVYGLKYRMEFGTLRGAACVVEIEQEGYTGGVQELTGGSSPFVMEADDDDFLYTPLRVSHATLDIVGGDYLQELFSTNYRMYRVTLLCDGAVGWCGYIEPETYTQDYVADVFEYEVECVSGIGVLDNIYYKRGTGEDGFVSLWAIMKRCIAESRGRYSAVYMPHVYAKDKTDYEAWGNPLETMLVSEQNFFDEDGEAMKLKEVLEEVMKLLGWTLHDCGGALYMVDADHEGGEYYKWDAALEHYERVQADAATVQDIGFGGDNHTLDVLPGYNRVTVKCSNYPIGNLLPDEEWEKLGKWGAATEYTQGPIEGDHTEWRVQALKGSAYSPQVYSIASDSYRPYIEKVIPGTELDAYADRIERLAGAIPMRWCSWEVKKGKPTITDYNWEYGFWLRNTAWGSGNLPRQWIWPSDNTNVMLRIKGASAVYSGGAFGLNFQVHITAPILGNRIIAPMPSDEKNGWNTFNLRFQLRIGKKYYHTNTGGDKYSWEDVPADAEHNWLQPEIGTMNYEWDQFCNSWMELTDQRTLGDGYDGVKGYIIKLPDEPLNGDLELLLFGPHIALGHTDYPGGIHLKGFEFKFENKEGVGAETESSDRYYENVMNEAYIHELDEIELKISSYNNDGACYSKVLWNGAYLTDNLYCGLATVEKAVRPEELLVRRIISHYSSTRLKLTQELLWGGIRPFTLLTDRYMAGRKFLPIGGEWDVKMDVYRVVMVEI